MQILTWFISRDFFQTKITVSFKKATLQKNFVIVEEELDGIDIDEAGNLEDPPRFVFIDEKCESLIIVNDGRNKNQKKNSGVL